MGEVAAAAGGRYEEFNTGLGAFGTRGTTFGTIASELPGTTSGQIFLILFKLLLQALGAVLGFVAFLGSDLLRGALAGGLFLGGSLFLGGGLAGSGSGGHGVTTGRRKRFRQGAGGGRELPQRDARQRKKWGRGKDRKDRKDSKDSKDGRDTGGGGWRKERGWGEEDGFAVDAWRFAGAWGFGFGLGLENGKRGQGERGASGEVGAEGGHGGLGAVAEDAVVAGGEEGGTPPVLHGAGTAEGAALELDVESGMGAAAHRQAEIRHAFLEPFRFELAGADGGDGEFFAGFEEFGFGAEERAVGDGVEQMQGGPFAGVHGGPGDDGALLGVLGGFLGGMFGHGVKAGKF